MLRVIGRVTHQLLSIILYKALYIQVNSVITHFLSVFSVD